MVFNILALLRNRESIKEAEEERLKKEKSANQPQQIIVNSNSGIPNLTVEPNLLGAGAVAGAAGATVAGTAVVGAGLTRREIRNKNLNPQSDQPTQEQANDPTLNPTSNVPKNTIRTKDGQKEYTKPQIFTQTKEERDSKINKITDEKILKKIDNLEVMDDFDFE